MYKSFAKPIYPPQSLPIATGYMKKRNENVAFPFAICSLEFIAAACQDLRILATEFQMTDDRQRGCMGHAACCMLLAFCKLVKVKDRRYEQCLDLDNC